MGWLDGKKSYLASIAGGIVGLCASFGWITPEIAAVALSIIGTFFGVSLRLGVAKSAPPK